MKKLFVIAFTLFVFIACTNSKKEKPAGKDKRIALRSDTINVVTMADTMIIYESTCRGCAYEQSTDFDVLDSLGIVELYKVITTDNNPGNVDGGSISKDLIIVPVKPGATTIKVIKTWSHDEDSTVNSSIPPGVNFYTIDVRN